MRSVYPGGQGFMAVDRPPIGVYEHGEVAAGTTISHGSSRAAVVKVRIQATGGAGVTMTALPNIQVGSFDGQILYLEMDKDSTQAVTLQDQATLAGSLLRLTAATLAHSLRDNIAFVWSAEEGMWISALGGRVNNL